MGIAASIPKQAAAFCYSLFSIINEVSESLAHKADTVYANPARA